MHSSRMRTVRCSGRLMGGGVFAQGGVSAHWGMSAQGVSVQEVESVCPGGRGCLPKRVSD